MDAEEADFVWRSKCKAVIAYFIVEFGQELDWFAHNYLLDVTYDLILCKYKDAAEFVRDIDRMVKDTCKRWPSTSLRCQLVKQSDKWNALVSDYRKDESADNDYEISKVLDYLCNEIDVIQNSTAEEAELMPMLMPTLPAIRTKPRDNQDNPKPATTDVGADFGIINAGGSSSGRKVLGYLASFGGMSPMFVEDGMGLDFGLLTPRQDNKMMNGSVGDDGN
jgi:hypothetical protein